MFAIIRTGAKQYKVSKNDKIKVERLEGNEGDTVKFGDVLFIGGEKSSVGAPFVPGAEVQARIVAQGRAPKIIVFKKKRRQNYRRKNGHKQLLTVLEITDIKAA